MPRPAKISANTKKQVVTSYVDLEKGFVTAKLELIKQSEKLLDSLKKQEKQLKSMLAKAQAEKKSAKNKRVGSVSTARKGGSKTALKQLGVAKKAYDAASKTVEKLQAESTRLNLQLVQARISNKKYNSLAKIIEKFNKNWEKKAVKMTSAKKRRKVRKSAKSAKNTIVFSSPSFESSVM